MTEGKPQQKKTKLEKIAELESELKLLKEENRRLRKEKEGKGGSSSSRGKKGAVSDEEQEKMKDAISALRRVTITQEKALQSLRAKASQRRKELERKDEIIAFQKKQILQTQTLITDMQGGNQLRAKLGEYQKACFELEGRNDELCTEIDELKSRLSNYENSHMRGTGRFNSSQSNLSLVSTDSGSTQHSADMLRMKRQLADKGNEIATLHMRLEAMSDALYDLKHQDKEDDPFLNGSYHDNSKFSKDKNFDPFASMSSFDQDTYDEDDEYVS